MKFKNEIHSRSDGRESCLILLQVHGRFLLVPLFPYRVEFFDYVAVPVIVLNYQNR